MRYSRFLASSDLLSLDVPHWVRSIFFLQWDKSLSAARTVVRVVRRISHRPNQRSNFQFFLHRSFTNQRWQLGHGHRWCFCLWTPLPLKTQKTEQYLEIYRAMMSNKPRHCRPIRTWNGDRLGILVFQPCIYIRANALTQSRPISLDIFASFVFECSIRAFYCSFRLSSSVWYSSVIFHLGHGQFGLQNENRYHYPRSISQVFPTVEEFLWLVLVFARKCFLTHFKTMPTTTRQYSFCLHGDNSVKFIMKHLNATSGHGVSLTIASFQCLYLGFIYYTLNTINILTWHLLFLFATQWWAATWRQLYQWQIRSSWDHSNVMQVLFAAAAACANSNMTTCSQLQILKGNRS